MMKSFKRITQTVLLSALKRNILAVAAAGLCLFAITGVARAVVISDVSIYVDAAPNVYGSPDYTPWKDDTFAAVEAGTFVNMSNGINPANVGTTDFEIEDEVVYSFGDLGKRLTWIYWIPNTTVADLDGILEISLVNIWDGDVWDMYDTWYGNTWVTPTRWEDYMGGVIGTAGMAWWGAYNDNTPEELASDINDWRKVEEQYIFSVRLNGQEEVSMTNNRAAIPEPAMGTLFGLALIGLGLIRRRRS